MHPVQACPAKVGKHNAGGMNITASPEDFAMFTCQYFDQQSRNRGRVTFNRNPRGGASAGRGRGAGGRGGFTPRQQTVNAVCENEDHQSEDYEAAEEEQYDEDPEVVAYIEDLALN